MLLLSMPYRQTNTKFFGQCCESARHNRHYIKRTSSLYTKELMTAKYNKLEVIPMKHIETKYNMQST